MKIILFLVISGISNGSDVPFNYPLEKSYDNLQECVKSSIIMRKVLRAEDNLQARQTDVYAHCEVSQQGINAQQYAQAMSKIRRLEKFYTTAKW